MGQETRKDGYDFINSLSREEFYNNYIKGICKTHSFSAIATFLSANSSENEKEEVRGCLADLGVPNELMETDDDLDLIVASITERSVHLR